MSTEVAKRTHCSKAAAGKELVRLSAVPKWLPQAAEGRDEIVKALCTYCASDEHATRVMTWFLENTTECSNVVAELIRIAREVILAGDSKELPQPCDRCRGVDFVMFDKVINGVTYCARKRCDCERGQTLKAKDEARFAARDARDRAVGEAMPQKSKVGP